MNAKRKATDNEIDLPAKFSRIDEVLSRGNNSLMQLNEIGIKGLRWNMEQISNVFPQKFRATCIFGEPFAGFYELIPSGTVFYCEAASKSACKHDIANQIMDRLSGKDKPNKPLMQVPIPMSKPIVIKDDVDGGQSNSNGDSLKMDSAVRILNEKMRDIVYNFVLQEDGYCCYVSFRGFLIKGVGSNKKIAKRVVASKILQKYYKIVVTDDMKSADFQAKTGTNAPTPVFDKTPPSRQKNFSNLIQAMVKNGFEKMVSTLDVQYSKRKVLAGIIISRKLKSIYPEYYRCEDESRTPLVTDPLLFYTRTSWNINPEDPGEILKLVTISSGTKCLSGSDINDGGLALNDCHAEVVSKRAFQYFINQVIYRLQNGIRAKPFDILYGCDVLESLTANNHEVYRMKDDVKVHLYVSSPPCGDSRIFLPQSLNASLIEEYEEEPATGDDPHEDTHPNRKNRGLLRTKIECGEGTIPIKTKYVQTWDGILGGERLLTMSCSDKVCSWNVLGIQGALLTNVLSHPIYLDSLTIGSLFHQEHLERALYERAQGVSHEPGWTTGDSSTMVVDDVEQGELRIDQEYMDVFHASSPYILTVTDQDERCPGKASNFSVNWILGEDSFEIISTSKGMKIDNTSSRLCKNNLFKSFLRIFKWIEYVNSDDGYYHYNEIKSLNSYPDRAVGASTYQRKKITLFKYFDKQNFGRWIGKPVEQDWFGVRKDERPPAEQQQIQQEVQQQQQGYHQ